MTWAFFMLSPSRAAKRAAQSLSHNQLKRVFSRSWSGRTARANAVPEASERSRAFIRAYQDRLDALGDMQVPCLVMGFEQGADKFVTRAREIPAAIPDNRYVELTNAGHLTPVTEPHRVISPVLEFFAEMDRGSERRRTTRHP
jgi:pimeloyl-ACP methyl ester carboxylesterase